ncbi:isochorismatase family protein [Nonomuraea sp. NPDC059023]|uniref:isochorismatase family protein n=1 Tax=unclassified Nonomuraea TaxID=2593643 RepID=UPI0036A149E4
MLNWNAVTDDLLPELTASDRVVVESTGYGTPRALGTQPALILVDFQYAYLGDDVSLLDQLARNPSAGGAKAWRAMRASLPLLRMARHQRVPVVLSRIAYAPGTEQDNTFAAKRGNAAAFVDGAPGTQLAAELEAGPADILLRKEAASCFHQTNLHERLSAHGVDTVIIGGLSTSGCVRATAVDAAGYGYRVAVLRDATADRIDLSQRVTLFDIWLKYGDVIDTREAQEHLSRRISARNAPEAVDDV